MSVSKCCRVPYLILIAGFPALLLLASREPPCSTEDLVSRRLMVPPPHLPTAHLIVRTVLALVCFSVSTSLLFYSTLHKALFLLLPSHSPALSAQSLVFSVDHNREKSSSPALRPLTFSLVLSSCSPLQPEPESKRDQTQVPSSSL